MVDAIYSLFPLFAGSFARSLACLLASHVLNLCGCLLVCWGLDVFFIFPSSRPGTFVACVVVDKVEGFGVALDGFYLLVGVKI